MIIEQIKIENATDDLLTVTLRGKPEALIHALVHGLEPESLIAIKDALDAELATRKTHAD